MARILVVEDEIVDVADRVVAALDSISYELPDATQVGLTRVWFGVLCPLRYPSLGASFRECPKTPTQGRRPLPGGGPPVVLTNIPPGM